MFYTDLNSGVDIGSNCSVLEIGPFRILLDCGMHPKKLGRGALPQLSKISSALVDFAVLTHCHLDHLAGFPVFSREHPNTPIFCSPASKLVAKRILRNSVSVMERQREESHIIEYPLFTYSELDRVEANLTALPVGVPRTIFERGEQITVTLFPAGHVAGAVGVMFEYKHRRIFCTGDVSFDACETVDGAAFPKEKIDTLIMETTRGAAEVDPELTRDAEIERLVGDIAGTLAGGGSVLVPVFAFGRMQDMIHILLSAKNKGLIEKDVPVFCTGLGLDLADYFDVMSKKTGMVEFHRSMMKDLGVRKLERFEDPGTDVAERGIYLVSSGMLTERTPSWRLAANILDHARNLVAFVGYCDPDTPGGRLLTRTNVDELRFNDLDYIARVRASVARYQLSGHTTRERMMDFVNEVEPRQIILTHGDPEAREWFAEEIAIQLPRTKTLIPVPGEEIEC